MSEHGKVFKWHCFEKFTKVQLGNMKIVMETLRNSNKTLSIQNLIGKL